MKEEKDIWIEKVMESHKGKTLLEPSTSIFDNILKQTNKTKLVSIRQMAIAGVAASVLLLINGLAIHSVNNSDTLEDADLAYDSQVISDYNLYEYE